MLMAWDSDFAIQNTEVFDINLGLGFGVWGLGDRRSGLGNRRLGLRVGFDFELVVHAGDAGDVLGDSGDAGFFASGLDRPAQGDFAASGDDFHVLGEHGVIVRLAHDGLADLLRDAEIGFVIALIERREGGIGAVVGITRRVVGIVRHDVGRAVISRRCGIRRVAVGGRQGVRRIAVGRLGGAGHAGIRLFRAASRKGQERHNEREGEFGGGIGCHKFFISSVRTIPSFELVRLS